MQLLILALQLGLAVASVDGSLYIYKGATGPIKEYTATKNDFHKSRKPRVVDFYSPHCVGTIIDAGVSINSRECSAFSPSLFEIFNDCGSFATVIINFYNLF